MRKSINLSAVERIKIDRFVVHFALERFCIGSLGQLVQRFIHNIGYIEYGLLSYKLRIISHFGENNMVVVRRHISENVGFSLIRNNLHSGATVTELRVFIIRFESRNNFVEPL